MKGIRLSSPRFLHDDLIDHSDMNPEISIRNHTDRKLKNGEWGFDTREGNESIMNIAAMTFQLRASWVHSLKEKRMIVKSLTAQLQNRFHVSAAEIDEQDTHQIIVIGVAAIVPHNARADSLMEEISLFVENNCEAEIVEEIREIR